MMFPSLSTECGRPRLAASPSRRSFAGDDPALALEQMLAEHPAVAANRAANPWCEATDDGRRDVVLFGAGHLGRKTLHGLRQEQVRVVAFADNCPDRWGTEIDGLPVVSAVEAVRRFSDGAFVVTVFSPGNRFIDIRDQLHALGAVRVIPFAAAAWRYPENFSPHGWIAPPQDLLARADDIRRAFQLLDDEVSRVLFVDLLHARLTLDFDDLPQGIPDDQYFPADVRLPVQGEWVIDGGAYTGDTLERYLQVAGPTFGRWLAYEPDPASFRRLHETVASLPSEVRRRVDLRPAALGRVPGVIRFAGDGSPGSAVDSKGPLEVRVERVDDRVDLLELTSATPILVKLDVEGAEADALHGLKSLAERALPALAVCIYHKPNDLFEILLQIASWSSAYRFMIRVHETDGYDTVLYALPDDVSSRSLRSTDIS